MSQPSDAPAEPIQLIVRRRHDEDEGHHGGVWKIAYADFMTAMMAFFLVMWLVNAANTEMKSSVASYFNPIKLSDTVIRKKGLLDVDGKANAEETSQARHNTPPGMSERKADEGKRLQPGDAGDLGVEDQHGKAAAPEPTDSPMGRDGNSVNAGRASEAGRAFRDPFNPFAPAQLMSQEGRDPAQMPARIAGTPTDSGESPPSSARDAAPAPPSLPRSRAERGTPAPAVGAGTQPASGRMAAAGDRRPGPDDDAEQVARRHGPAGEAQGGRIPNPDGEDVGGRRPGPTGDAQELRLPGIAEAARQFARGADAPAEKFADAAKAQPESRPPSGAGQKEAAADGRAEAPAASGQKPLETAAGDLLRDIQQAAKPVAGAGGPGIEVTIESNGIVLSLTDTSTFGMFAIGSSDPSPQTIELIARIAPVLIANGKRIVVRGHTDSRAYRTDRNNNWRLSMSRAEAAYAMLVRAGVDEARFVRIEGYADRKLKVPGDSEAAANRRIEILLQQVDE
ncbi:MAG: flagellar motor protein MotB [Hyphomicrobiaceae bacterium]